MRSVHRLFSAIRWEQSAWQSEGSCLGASCSVAREHASKGFCSVPLPPDPGRPNSFGLPVAAVSDSLDEAACFGSTFRSLPREWSVNVKSFLLGSQLDLSKLKPQFRDVLRSEGKVSRLLSPANL